MLGSAILPPSWVPKRNLMFPYVVLSYVSLCFWPVSTLYPDFPPPYYISLYITSFTSIHPLVSHPSHPPLIFPSVHLCLPGLPLDLHFICIFPVLGSVILPPSRVPKWNPRTPYVVCTYSSFVSDRFPPRFRTYLSVPYITLFHLLHFRSPVD